MIQRLSDWWLEYRIGFVFYALMHEKDRNEQRWLACLHKNLIKQRSPQQIARMERRMGIDGTH